MVNFNEISTQDAVIVFEDEASLSNTATVSYSWGKKESSPAYPNSRANGSAGQFLDVSIHRLGP